MIKLSHIAAAALAVTALQIPAFAQTDVCRNCGVVQSVQTVTRTSQPKGMGGTPVTPGMAIGGLAGAAVGNQIGGNTAGTVLGAAGGAYLGHSIEKKQYRAYVMRVRMNDGTVRTIEQPTALAKGSHVVVDGKTARLQRANHDNVARRN